MFWITFFFYRWKIDPAGVIYIPNHHILLSGFKMKRKDGKPSPKMAMQKFLAISYKSIKVKCFKTKMSTMKIYYMIDNRASVSTVKKTAMWNINL